MSVKSVNFGKNKRIVAAIIALIFIILIIPIKDVVSFKEDVSGYKIDVTYQDNKAILSGNATEVAPTITLNKIVDKDNQELDPNNLSIEITENGEYHYSLYYSLTQNEVTIEKVQTITVVIDEIPQPEPVVEETPTEETPTEETPTESDTSESTDGLIEVSPDVLQEQDGQTIINVQDLGFEDMNALFRSVQEKATKATTFAAYPYAQETYNQAVKVPLKGTVSNPGTIQVPYGNVTEANIKAQYTSAIKSVNGQSNREFGNGAFVSLYRQDGTNVEIAGLFTVSVNGVAKKFYSIKNSSGGIVPIGYEMASTDKIRVYYTLGTQQATLNYQFNSNAQNNVPTGYTLTFSPSRGSGTVKVGTVVVVELTWPGTKNTPSISGVTKTDISKDEKNRKWSFYFTMPSTTTNVKITDSTRSGNKWFGIYDSDDTYFNDYELGFTKISTTSGGTNASVGIQKLPATDDRANFYPSTDTRDIKGGYTTIKGYMSNTGGTQIQYPVVNYTPSTSNVLSATIEIFRGMRSALVPNYPTNWDYEIHPVASLDVFRGGYNINNPNDSGTQAYMKGFTRYGIKLYQTEQEYNTQKQTESSLAPGWQGNQIWTNATGAQQSGVKLYPVVTNLPNGIKVTVWPQAYAPNRAISSFPSDNGQYGNYGFYNNTPLTYITANVYIQYAYDDIRLSFNATSTVHDWYAMSKIEGVDVKSDGSYNGTLDNAALTTSTYVNVNSASSGRHRITVKPKLGYSAPTAMMYNRTGGSVAKKIYLDKSQANSSGDYNPFYVNGTFYNSGTGMYTFYFDHKYGHLAYSIQIVCNPLTFSYNFEGLTGIESSGSGYNVNKRYFAVPTNIPTGTSNFIGWDIQVTVNGSTITIDNGGQHYAPRDLIDVIDIYEKIVGKATANRVSGVSSFTLNFKPVAGSNASASLITTAVYKKYMESESWRTDALVETRNNISVLKNQYATWVDYDNVIQDSNGRRYMISARSQFGANIGNNAGTVVAQLYYDRIYTVDYWKKAEGATSDTINGKPTDTNEYTNRTVNGNQIVTVKGLGTYTVVDPNYEFVGWKLQGDTSGTIYTEGETINLADDPISNGAKQNIFNTGKINFIPVVQKRIDKIVSNNNGSTIQELGPDTLNVTQEKTEIIVSSTFKYAGTDITEGEFDNLFTNDSNTSELKIALYKANPGSSTWTLWGDNTNGAPSGNSNSRVTGVSVTGDYTTKVITVKYTIRPDNVKGNDDAQFKIYAWTAANGNYTAQNVNTANSNGMKVPSHTNEINIVYRVTDNDSTETTERTSSFQVTQNSFEVTAEFKYDKNNGTALDSSKLNEILKNTADSLIKVRLYRAIPDESGNYTTWDLWGDNTGGTGSGSSNVTDVNFALSNNGSNKFTVTYTVSVGDLEYNHEAKFKIVAWSVANIAMDSSAYQGSTNTNPNVGVDVNIDDVHTNTYVPKVTKELIAVHYVRSTDGTIVNSTSTQNMIHNTFTISADFKYDIQNATSGTLDANRIAEIFSTDNSTSILKLALFRNTSTDANNPSWELFGNNGGKAYESSSVSGTPTVEVVENQTNVFRVTFTLTLGSTEYNHGAQFRIAAWTAANNVSYTNTDMGATNVGDINTTINNGGTLPATTITTNAIHKVTSINATYNNDTITEETSVKDITTTSFDVTAQFKYNLDKQDAVIEATRFSELLQETDNSTIKVALYRKDANGTWQIMGNNTGALSDSGVTNVTLAPVSNSNNFNVTFTISKTDYEAYDGSQFRIVAWTEANGVEESQDGQITITTYTNDSSGTDAVNTAVDATRLQSTTTTTTAVRKITSAGSATSGQIQDQKSTVTVREGNTLNIQAQFKYESSIDLTQSKLQSLIDSGKMKMVLYRRTPNGTSWTFVKNLGATDITSVDGTSKTFTATHALTATDTVWADDNKDQYKIIAWTVANAAVTSNNQTIPSGVGTTIPAVTQELDITRNLTAITEGSNTAEVITTYTNSNHTISKNFTGAGFDTASDDAKMKSLTNQRFDFSVRAYNDAGTYDQTITDVTQSIDLVTTTSGMVVSSVQNAQNGADWKQNDTYMKTAINGAELTIYFWGDSVKLYGSYSGKNTTGSIDIYIDGKLQEKAYPINNTYSSWFNQLFFDSGYIGYKAESTNKSDLHVMKIVANIPNSGDVVQLNSIQYTTAHRLQTPDGNTINYTFDTNVTSETGVTVTATSASTNSSLDNVKFEVSAWNVANTTGNKAVAASDTLKVISPITSESGTITDTSGSLEIQSNANGGSDLNITATFKYNDTYNDNVTLSNLFTYENTSKIKVALYRSTYKNNQYQAWELCGDNTGITANVTSNPQFDNRSIRISQVSGTNDFKVEYAFTIGSTEFNENAKFRIVAWTDANGNGTSDQQYQNNDGDKARVNTAVDNKILPAVTTIVTTVELVTNVDGSKNEISQSQANWYDTNITSGAEMITVTASFRYNTPGTANFSTILTKDSTSKIKVGLYKQESGSSNWVKWGDNTGVTFGNANVPSADDLGIPADVQNRTDVSVRRPYSVEFTTNTEQGTNVFSVTYKINLTDLSGNDGAQYRIVAWTSGNGDSITTDNVMDSVGGDTPLVPSTKVTLSVLYRVTHTNNSVNSGLTGTQTIYNTAETASGTNIIVQNDFKYNTGKTITAEQIKGLFSTDINTPSTIKVALYRSNNGTDWQLYGNNYGGTGSGTGLVGVPTFTVKDTDTTNKTFTISYTVTPTDISAEDEAQYKIVAWTEANGGAKNASNYETITTSNAQNSTNVTALTDTLTVVEKIKNASGSFADVSESATYSEGAGSYNLTSTFKYSANQNHLVALDIERLNTLYKNGEIKFAFYKQDPSNLSAGQWIYLGDGKTDKTNITNITVTANNVVNRTFDVTFTVQGPDMDEVHNDGARIKVVAWTNANTSETINTGNVNNVASLPTQLGSSIPTVTKLVRVSRTFEPISYTDSDTPVETDVYAGDPHSVDKTFTGSGFNTTELQTVLNKQDFDFDVTLTDNDGTTVTVNDTTETIPAKSGNLGDGWSVDGVNTNQISTKKDKSVLSFTFTGESVKVIPYLVELDINNQPYTSSIDIYIDGVLKAMEVSMYTGDYNLSTSGYQWDNYPVYESGYLGSGEHIIQIVANINKAADIVKFKEIQVVNGHTATVNGEQYTYTYNVTNTNDTSLDVTLNSTNTESTLHNSTFTVSAWNAKNGGNKASASPTSINVIDEVLTKDPTTTGAIEDKPTVTIDQLPSTVVGAPNTINITASFDYKNTYATDTEIQELINPTDPNKPKLQYALYRQTNGGQWVLYDSSNDSSVSNSYGTITEEVTVSNRVITISYKIQPNDGFDQNDLSSFKVIAWTEANTKSFSPVITNNIPTQVGSTIPAETQKVNIIKAIHSFTTDVDVEITNTTDDIDVVNTTYTITADFKYDSTATLTAERLNELLKSNKIKTEIFRKKVGENYWFLWGNNNGNTGSGGGAITTAPTITKISNNTFTIEYSITLKDTFVENNNAEFMVIAWTGANSSYLGGNGISVDDFANTEIGKTIPSSTITTSTVKKVASDSDMTIKDTTENKIITIPDKYTLEGKFHYDYAQLDASILQDLFSYNVFKVAFYKKNPNDSTWHLWAYMNGAAQTVVTDHAGKVGNISFSYDEIENMINVSVPILNYNNSITEQWEQGAEYRMYVWTEENGNFGFDTSITESTQTQQTRIADNNGMVASYTHKISALTIDSVVKYPKSIILMDQVNGDIASGTQLITLSKFDSSGNPVTTNDVSNDTFTASVLNTQIPMMDGSETKFTSYVYNSDGTKLTGQNTQLGSLKYHDVINNTNSTGTYAPTAYIQFSLKTTASELQGVTLDGLPELNGTLNFRFTRTPANTSGN